jgi:hypothetical protein
MGLDTRRVLRFSKPTLFSIVDPMRTKIQPPSPGIEDGEFSEPISLREAYRIMEIFVQDYLSRGDTSVSDFLCYAGLGTDGYGGDPAALDDFLTARQKLKTLSAKEAVEESSHKGPAGEQL